MVKFRDREWGHAENAIFLVFCVVFINVFNYTF